MRLHRLELRAFGPFAGTQVVDLDRLGDAGLFLLQGPTGAGKTSVLDAVAFALYGRVPGARGSVHRLRSDHADPDIGPRVLLEVTLRGRRLRVERSPQWQRPKRRGAGTTSEQARVRVEERVGATWVHRSSRLDEAGHLLSELLGMTLEQFCQVVLLPQGAFAQFLGASADERRAVLERLFNCGVYPRVEQFLRDHAQELRRAADAALQRCAQTADRVAECAGAERPDAPVEQWVTWVGELRAAAAAELTGHTDKTHACVAAAEQAAAALAVGVRLADRQRQHADARARLAAVQAAVPDRARVAARLDAAEAAAGVAPLVEALESAAAAVAEARRAVRAAREAAQRSGADLRPDAGTEDPGIEDAEQVAAAERASRDTASSLRALLPDARRRWQAEREADAAERRVAALVAEEAALRSQLAGFPAERDELGRHRDAAVLASLGLDSAVADEARAAGVLAAASSRDALLDEERAAAEVWRAAVDAAQAATERWLALREARLDGMAAELAASLRPSTPCPVCGAGEHPRPATAGRVVSAATERAAHRNADRLAGDRQDAERALGEVRAELAGARALGGTVAVDIAAAAVEAAGRRVTAARDAGKEAVRLQELLTGLERQHEVARTALAERATRLADARAAVRSLRRELTALKARVDSTPEDLDAAAGRHDRTARLLADLAESLRRLTAAAAAETDAAARAARCAKSAGFTDVAGAAAAILSPAEADAARRRIRGWDDERAAALALLGQPSVVAAAAEPPPHLADLREAARSADLARDVAVSALARARGRCDRLTVLDDELADRVAAWVPQDCAAATAQGLARLAGGTSSDNAVRMSLSAYVLTARLEQVAAAASERLEQMTSGRFALRHTAERGDGDRRGGLGLRVTDAWTGEDRHPGTLSGGETFLASLALALGLADVVAAEAGGAPLDTLFVDEGFGGLDDTALEDVLDVLDGLREGGRVVGVVSHVPAMRERIPAQLVVGKDRTGSHLSVRGC